MLAARPSGVARPKRDRLSERINHPYFDKMVRILIAANIAVMALYRFDLDDTKKEYLVIAEGFFVSAFMLEVILRGLAAKDIGRRIVTFKPTNEDLMLVFDTGVVAISATVMWGKGMNLTSLRIPRLFKTFGPAKSQTGVDTINRVFKSLGSLLSLFLFYVAILAMYAVLGMQLFANRDAGLEREAPPKFVISTVTCSASESSIPEVGDIIAVTPVSKAIKCSISTS